MIRIGIPKERRFQCIAYAVGFIFLCLPLFLHLIVIPMAGIPAFLSSSYKLMGFTQQKPMSMNLSLKSFFNREFQESVEHFAGNDLPLRSLLIRTNNQFYYSIFNKCYMYKSNIVVGKKGRLYEYGYIMGYNANRDAGLFRMEDIERSVRKIKSSRISSRRAASSFFILLLRRRRNVTRNSYLIGLVVIYRPNPSGATVSSRNWIRAASSTWMRPG